MSASLMYWDIGSSMVMWMGLNFIAIMMMVCSIKFSTLPCSVIDDA